MIKKILVFWTLFLFVPLSADSLDCRVHGEIIHSTWLIKTGSGPPTFSTRGFTGRRVFKLPAGLKVLVCQDRNRSQSVYGLYSVRWMMVGVRYHGKIVYGWVDRGAVGRSRSYSFFQLIPAAEASPSGELVPIPFNQVPKGPEVDFNEIFDPIWVKFYSLMFLAFVFGIAAKMAIRFIEGNHCLKFILKTGLASLILSPFAFMVILQSNMVIDSTQKFFFYLAWSFQSGYMAKDIVGVRIASSRVRRGG